MRPEGLAKFKNSPYRVSNQRPSSLLHSASTTTLPTAPALIFCVVLCYILMSMFYVKFGSSSDRSSGNFVSNISHLIKIGKLLCCRLFTIVNLWLFIFLLCYRHFTIRNL
jgi:hypothetical protein